MMRRDDLTFIDSPADPAKRLASLRNGINHVAFSPDGQFVATSDVHMNVYVMRGEETVFNRSFSLINDKIRPTQRVRALTFSHDSRLLFLAASDTVYAIDVATGEEVWTYVPPRSFGFLIISPLALVTNRAGDVAAVFDNGSTAVWDEGGLMKSLWHHNDGPRMIDFASDGKTIVGTDSFTLTGWSWETRKRVFKLSMPERVYGLALSPTHSVAATRTLHAIHLWDLESKAAMGALPVGFGLPLVTFHPKDRLLCFGERHSVMLTDFEGRVIDRREIDAAAILSIAFSPDGSEIAIGCSDNEVRHWKLNG